MVTEAEAKASLDAMSKNMIEKEKEEAGYTKNNVRINAMAQEIINTATIKSMRDNDEMWFYHTKLGYYTKDAESFIASKCASEMSVNDKISKVRDVVRGLTYRNREDFGTPEGMLNVSNGVLDLRTMQLLPWSHEYNFKGCMEVAYIPGATCPKFLEYLSWALAQKSIKIIQKWFGYHFMRGQKYKKGIMLYGAQDSGKSQILKALQKILGESMFSAASLADFNEATSHAVDEMYGKIANVDADLGSETIENAAMFKKITGGDLCRANPKFKDPFDFYPDAKLSFGCNTLPPLKSLVEDDTAFWTRWLLVHFTKTIDADKINVNFFEENIQPELPGILNWAIEGYHLLQKEGFCYDTDENIDMWRESIETGGELYDYFTFYYDQKQGEDLYLTKDVVYESYRNDCIGLNRRPMTATSFGIKFKKYAQHGRHRIRKEDGTNPEVRTWDGIQFKALMTEQVLARIKECGA